MSRPSKGQVLERQGERGTVFAIRFYAYGKRHYETLGTAKDGWTRPDAETHLQNVLADVRRGIWRPPDAKPPIEEPRPEPTFHAFSSEWLAAKRPELGKRTAEDYAWALTHHLLPFFAGHRLSQITKQEVDRYKAAKVRERQAFDEERAQAKKRGESLPIRGLSANTINKTLTRLAQILEAAVDYDLLAANPAHGRRRRLKGTRPARPWVEPEQLPTLLECAAPLLGGRGKALLAVLAGAGLRIGEATALRRRDVNLAKGTLRVVDAKTAAGVRTVDLTPAVREELALWLDKSRFKQPTDLVFPTLKG
jgi:integrase